MSRFEKQGTGDYKPENYQIVVMLASQKYRKP